MIRVIKFEKDNCAPCNMVSEFLDNKGINYEKVNPFENPEVAMRFRVRTVPTVIVTKENEEVKRVIGFKPEELLTISSLQQA
ncbi:MULTISPECIES: thioredoxin family protein [Olivibacter]|uniref:Thioredoxin family protein n=1 Tax=Olivibacter oleidegradans TaxID=760123 RepID=A0ABV6HI98_9SPHI|nr:MULTISPECIES: thioredoxin family protein [Olivibacter]MDM8174701.1 thioredoxin family protein [Olivibacter sp. 47]MDX3913545.1 thioredoxin family protein [Pseudosphingobacterium sp.]QEL01492.1 thioredoxin family protein [Olivibacter sp. LS-1]